MSHHIHDNDPRFVEYYRIESASQRAVQRAIGIMDAVIRVRRSRGSHVDDLRVADIGCNAGTQSRCWLERGHQVNGIDISADLVALARDRNAEFGDRVNFVVGSATSLPWAAESFDICLLPELLEHVVEWETCLHEAVRVLKPGGTLYLSTTNALCPVQQEFTLPGYSWYPKALKDRIVTLARTTRPQLANFATFPAMHWFTPYGLSRVLRRMGMRSLDRFDLIDAEGRNWIERCLVDLIRKIPLLRLAAHMATPSTVMLGMKDG